MSRYKVRNWSQYNESLKNRGNLSLWVSEDALKKWRAPKIKGINGAPRRYSDDAILCIMMLKVIYHLPYRQLIGFLFSIFSMMEVALPIPHFTTVAERARCLGAHFKKLSKRKPTDLVFDSSGFKVFGEGEWQARKWGTKKRRRWKKFHIGICPHSHEIIVADVTELETADCEIGPRLMNEAPSSVERVTTDGAYDTFKNYRSAHENEIDLLVPPRAGAIAKGAGPPWVRKRDQAILEVIGLGGNEDAMKLWKRVRGYHKRSLVETAFSRFKGIFGPKLFSKNIDNQRVELFVKARVMNNMSAMGMPKGAMI
jgi:hypothetical protein